MKINLELIKKLRKITFAGFSNCKEALEESKNNLEKAIEILKKKGINKVLKRSEINRSINEGCVVVKVFDNIATLIEMRCETDFVSKNKNYLKFIEKINEIGVNELNKSNNFEINLKENKEINDFILKESSKFGEKIELSEFYYIKKEKNQEFSFYQHTNLKRGSLLVIENLMDKELLEGIAMQVVALQPDFISVSEIKEEYKNNKKKDIEEEINKKLFNKSEEMRKKIIINKLEKELKEITLLNQKYIKDESKTIKEILLNKKAKIISMKLSIIEG